MCTCTCISTFINYCDQLVDVVDVMIATDVDVVIAADVTLVEVMKVALNTVILSIVMYSCSNCGLSMKHISLSSITMRVHNSFGGTPSIVPLKPLKVFEMFLDGQCSFAQNLLCTLPST